MNKETKKLTCKLCGVKYQGCVTCIKSKDMYYSWRNVCCSAQHFGVYETIVDYMRNNITKKEARNILFNRANDYDSYTDINRKIVEDILFEENINESVDNEELEIEELDISIEDEELIEENECN